MNEYYIVPNPTGPASAIEIEEELCIGCNSCANICRIQTILPNPEKGRPPIVAYPDECWYCGCCVEACPTGALAMRLPINQRILFKDKQSGELFRIGADDAPQKSYFRAPFGWSDHPELGKVMHFLEDPGYCVSIRISAECGRQIGRFFGEKEETDNTLRLRSFLLLTGFDKVDDEKGEEADNVITASDREGGSTQFRLTVRQLSDLLHRLCVSSYTAVHVWRSL